MRRPESVSHDAFLAGHRGRDRTRSVRAYEDPRNGGPRAASPFSVYAADAAGGTLDVLYQTVGFGTNHLAALAPDVANEIESAELIGPVGRRWQAPAGTQRALLVGGGVGAAPLFMLCQELVGSGVHVDVVLGAQTADALVCLKRYEQLLSRDVRVATMMARSVAKASAPLWSKMPLPPASMASRISTWHAAAPSPL